jgi:phage anti-repressor protein
MIKKFTKQELKEKLGMKENDIKLVMDAQRKFPEVLVNDGEGFCVDGRKFHKELKVGKQFSEWIKSNLEKVDAVLDEDYTEQWIDDKGVFFKGYLENTSVTDLTGQGYKKQYMLTLDIAKEISMSAGASNRANKELKENSKLCRKYFIVIEKAVKNMVKWNTVREPERFNANIMRSKITEWCIKNGYDVNEGSYAREFNMINQAITGTTALGIKLKLGYKDKQTREHLDIFKNKTIDIMQGVNITLLELNMSFEDRKNFIENKCNTEYSDLKF